MKPVGLDPPLDPRTFGAVANSLAAAPRLPTLHSGSSHDSASVSLESLAAPAIQHLLQAVEDRLFPAGSHHRDSIHEPGHPASVGIALSARESAVNSVARAAHAIEHSPRVSGYPDPRAVLAVANQFIETGQVPNYLRAGELGREVLSWYEGRLVPPEIATELTARDRERQSRYRNALTRVWRRAPLLILLVVWLVAGLTTAFLLNADTAAYQTSLSVWAIGFLALVVVQFVISIRGSWRGKTQTGPKQ